MGTRGVGATIRAMRWILATIWMCVLLAAGPVLAGPEAVGAGSVTNAATGESHGWVVLPLRGVSGGASGGAAVQHIPPRGTDAEGRRGVEDGSVRLATTLMQMPSALAAMGNRLYMVFPARAGSEHGAARRPVLVIEAQRRSVDGDWVGESSEGRLPTVAALPGDGELVGFAGSPGGLLALLEGDAGRLELLRLMEDGWQNVGLPEGLTGKRVVLVGTGSGAALVVVGGRESGAWERRIEGKSASDGEWGWKPLSFVDVQSGQDVAPESGIAWVRGMLVYSRRVDGNVEVRAVGASGSRAIGVVPGVSRGYALAVLDQSGRVAVVWREGVESEGAAGEGRKPAERLMIGELSVLTGQLLYRGEAEPRRPFSAAELRLLAMFMVLVMLAIVVFVLRPEGSKAPLSLPEGTALAEPGRRMLAGAIDAMVALVLATRVTGIGVGELMDVRALMTQPEVVTLYLTTVGIGLGLGVLCEWAFGRTVGKALTGAETVRSVLGRTPEGEVRVVLMRVRLMGALARNIVKWVLPPVAMSGLGTPERRHRGDLAAGTVVIVRTARP